MLTFSTDLRPYLPSKRSMSGLRTMSLSCCIVVRWLGWERDTCPVPFTLDNKAPNSCILCCIWGSRDLAKMLLSSSSTPFNFCCSSFNMLAASASNWWKQNTINLWQKKPVVTSRLVKQTSWSSKNIVISLTTDKDYGAFLSDRKSWLSVAITVY